MSKNRLSRRREMLWKRCKGKCYYCKVKTTLPKDLATLHGLSVDDMCRLLKKEQYYCMATIDHLIPRYDARRLSKNRGEERTVLCCWKCNNDRARREYESLPQETIKRFVEAGKPAMYTIADMRKEKIDKVRERKNAEAMTKAALTKITWLDRILSVPRGIKKIYEYFQGRGCQGEDRTAPQCGKA